MKPSNAVKIKERNSPDLNRFYTIIARRMGQTVPLANQRSPGARQRLGLRQQPDLSHPPAMYKMANETCGQSRLFDSSGRI